jgi:hypothetical protein
MPLPLEFLLESSMRSLEDLELSSRNRAANLSKAIRIELDAFVEETAKAMLARWMIENRDALVLPEIKPKRVDLFVEVETRKKMA